MGASTKDKRDIYYRKGKAEGYRARSAYKLIHLDQLFAFLQPSSNTHSYATRFPSSSLPPRPSPHQQHVSEKKEEEGKRSIIDLCAAPGSWSQVLARTLSSKNTTLIAVDLQQMAPIPHILDLTADITLPSTAACIRSLSPGEEEVDLIICDGAPDIHGLHILDEFLHSFLIRAALSIVLRMLKPGGSFIAKIFSHDSRPTLSSTASLALRPYQQASAGGGGRQLGLAFRTDDTDAKYSARMILQSQLESLFKTVHIVKPASSRPSSAEHFIVCQDFLFIDDEEEDGDHPLKSSLWDSAQGRDCIAACLLEDVALPQDDGNVDEDERRRRKALHTLIRFAAQGDLQR
ncbi:hypothetical protein CF319_g7259 [Tilletia indica]|nr:hypothetical protein CF319_g7259 [Tilletia indica]